MTSTREKILQIILTRQKATINDLATEVGINPISVRHHIIKLESEGLVSSEDERHGVGRPRRVYFLTEDGMEKFPTRYLRLTNRLLGQIKDQLPKKVITKLFSVIGEEMAVSASGNIDVHSLPMEERLLVLQEFLQNEGFQIEWEKKDNEYHIRELSCPYYQIGQEHPEVCTVDKTLISNLLLVPATRVNCILHGDSYCTYVVPHIPLADVSTSTI